MSSCVQNKQKVDYKDNPATDSLSLKNLKNNTTKAIFARLPVYFDSTRFLIHPIEITGIAPENSRKLFGSSSDYSDWRSTPVDFGADCYGNYIDFAKTHFSPNHIFR